MKKGLKRYGVFLLAVAVIFSFMPIGVVNVMGDEEGDPDPPPDCPDCGKTPCCGECCSKTTCSGGGGGSSGGPSGGGSCNTSYKCCGDKSCCYVGSSIVCCPGSSSCCGGGCPCRSGHVCCDGECCFHEHQICYEGECQFLECVRAANNPIPVNCQDCCDVLCHYLDPLNLIKCIENCYIACLTEI